MSKKQPLESIATSVRCLIWIVAVPSVVFSAFLVVMTYMAVDAFLEAEESDTTRVVVAKTNLVAGTILTTNNLASKRFLESNLETTDYVCPGDADVLLGHGILDPLEQGEPIEWHNTDIVITNTQSPQPKN